MILKDKDETVNDTFLRIFFKTSSISSCNHNKPETFFSNSYRISDRTVSKIVNEVATAVWDTMQPLYLPQVTTEMGKSIALGFEQRWQFSHRRLGWKTCRD